MIFVTGPMFSGKKAYLKKLLALSEEEFEKQVAYDILEDVGKTTDIEKLVTALREYRAVILPEIGSGVIPMDEKALQLRENCGRLAVRLAEEADTVIRVVCGLPQVLKGKPEDKQ